MSGEEKEQSRKRRKPQSPNVPEQVREKLGIPLHSELMSIDSRWMFAVEGTRLIVTRNENKARRTQSISIEKIIGYPLLLAELVAWMSFALSTYGEFEDIANMVAEVEAFVTRLNKPGAAVSLSDFYTNEIFLSPDPNMWRLLNFSFHPSKSGGNSSSQTAMTNILFSEVLTMSNFFDFLNRPFYKNIDLEQKKQLLDEIVQLYFWSRYRIHTLAISLLRRSSTKKKTIEIGRKFIFHFFNVECSTVFPFATISKELIAYHLEKYLVELEKRVTSILGKLGLKEILAIQVEKLFDQVVTDLSLGIKTVFQTEYQNQPNDHNKTFYSRRTPNNVSVCSSGKNSALLEFTISQEKIVLPLTQNVIRVRQKLGGCPHPERTSSLVVCPHRTQE